MGKLVEAMLEPNKRPQVIKDCTHLIDDEVARKGGLSGLAIKGGYAVFKKVKPTAVEDAMDGLLNEFVEKLEPIHEEYLKLPAGSPLDGFLKSNSLRVANTLLAITDERGHRSKNPVVKGAYEKLRPLAVKQIEEALPAVARLVKKYVP